MPATQGKRVSLIYVCFFDFIDNGVKLGTANRMASRAYTLSLDWGMMDLKNSFYFQCTFQKHSNEVGQLERQILDILRDEGLKIQPCYSDGREAHGTGESEFFRYEGLPLVLEIFNKLEKEGKGKIIRGFEPSKNLPPLRSEPEIFMRERSLKAKGILPYNASPTARSELIAE